MRILGVALLVCLAGDRATAGPGTYAELACIGDGARAVVYLHGMDSTWPSPVEVANRAELAELASARGLRVALPRATTACPGRPASRCWGWAFDDDERDATAAAIAAAADACFAAGARYGVLGHSNGGYAALELVAHGEARAKLPGALWVVAVGASADVSDPFLGSARLDAQPGVVMVAGARDSINFDPADRYARRLERAGARVASIHYEGDHRLAGAPLAEAIDRAEALSSAPP